MCGGCRGRHPTIRVHAGCTVRTWRCYQFSRSRQANWNCRRSVGREECLATADGEDVAPGDVEGVGLAALTQTAVYLIGCVVANEVAVLRPNPKLGAVTASVIQLLGARVVGEPGEVVPRTL